MTAGEPKILVVDDNEDNRYTLTRRLRREGYADLREACDGREALALLRAEPADLVLLDVLMPELDGYEVLRRLKEDPGLRHIPVLVISAVTELESAVRCIELGAEDYLPKPFNPVLLRARVGACLEKKRLRDREAAHLAEIERQRRRMDELLHVILPAPAVAELAATDRVTPRRFEDVAVLFADVAGFTAYCDRHGPEEAVAGLQALVEAFEELTAAHGLEKIKTVGDAFMATAGLLEPCAAGPVPASVRCGFAMIGAAARRPEAWRVRVGVHVGPVVAGVVGRRKYAFDLWGDTVNVAARLAQIGEPGAVHLSGAARTRLPERCRVEARGRVAIKGKGEVEVYRCLTLDG